MRVCAYAAPIPGNDQMYEVTTNKLSIGPLLLRIRVNQLKCKNFGGPGGCLESKQNQVLRYRRDHAAFKSVPMLFDVSVPPTALYSPNERLARLNARRKKDRDGISVSYWKVAVVPLTTSATSKERLDRARLWTDGFKNRNTDSCHSGWLRRVRGTSYASLTSCPKNRQQANDAARLDCARPPDPQGPLDAHVRCRLLVEGYRFILVKTLAVMGGV